MRLFVRVFARLSRGDRGSSSLIALFMWSVTSGTAVMAAAGRARVMTRARADTSTRVRRKGRCTRAPAQSVTGKGTTWTSARR